MSDQAVEGMSAGQASLSLIGMAQESCQQAFSPWEPLEEMEGVTLDEMAAQNHGDRDLAAVSAQVAVAQATAAVALAQLEANQLVVQQIRLTVEAMQRAGAAPGGLITAQPGTVPPPFKRGGRR